jgi:hypothetical protein
MFPYSDPVGTNLLEEKGALGHYRDLVDAQYQRFARLENSAFTFLEAFDELAPGTEIAHQTIDWRAFPITAPATPAEIDADRLRFQDEYVEWRVERDSSGQPVRIVFTTEFSEWFEALARADVDALKEGVAEVIPGADPADAELFGLGPNPHEQSALTRSTRFRNNLVSNPWNVGAGGILCLTQRFNTLAALFNLVGQCGVPRRELPATAVCANVGGACGPGRNSDPAVCAAAQQLARIDFGLTLADPAGIVIRRLEGEWALDGQPIADINDPDDAQGIWRVTRNGRRAVLEIPPTLQLNGQPIGSGAQVADHLIVGASAIAAPDAALPAFARIGFENQLRGVV